MLNSRFPAAIFALLAAFAWWWCFGGMHAVFIKGIPFGEYVRDIFLMAGGAFAARVYFWFLED